MKNRIFIGSSKESIAMMDEVALILEDYGCEPIRWDTPGRFPPGDFPIDNLISLSNEVNGAIFIFSEDDKIWYRDNKGSQPRDNVLMEYGVFASTIGRRNAIIAMYNSPKMPSDILGINVIDLGRLQAARQLISQWIANFGRMTTVPFLSGRWRYQGISGDNSYIVSGHCDINQSGRQLHIWGTRKVAILMNGEEKQEDDHKYEWRSTWAKVCVGDGRIRIEYQLHKNLWHDGFMNLGFQDGSPDRLEGIFYINLSPNVLSGRMVLERLD